MKEIWWTMKDLKLNRDHDNLSICLRRSAGVEVDTHSLGKKFYEAIAGEQLLNDPSYSETSRLQSWFTWCKQGKAPIARISFSLILQCTVIWYTSFNICTLYQLSKALQQI